VEIERAAPAARLGWALAGVSAIVLVDQVTKAVVVATLSDAPLGIVGDTVELHVSRNSGGAFGRFQGMTMLLAVGAAIVSVVLVRALRRATDKVVVSGLVLVLGGALGNLVDRLARAPGFLRGHVVDFVKVGDFPIFNVADSCITIGALLLVWRSLRAAPS
jgi:signal peptidase II